MSTASYEATGEPEDGYETLDAAEPYISDSSNPQIAQMQTETAEAFARYRRTGQDSDLHGFLTQATPLVYAYCRKRFSAPSDVDDVAQETLLTLVTLAQQTEAPDRAIVPLIYKVAGFDVIDGRRSRDKALGELTGQSQNDQDTPEPVRQASTARSPDEVITANEELDEIEALLDGLPPAEALALRYKILGIRAVDAARQENKSPGAMRVALWKARNRQAGPDRPRLKQKTGTRKHPDTMDPPIPADQIPLATSLLDRLPRRQREVVGLALQGIPPRKIVELTGLSASSVSNHKQIGFRRIHPLLAEVAAPDNSEGTAQQDTPRREIIAAYIGLRYSWITYPEALEAITDAVEDSSTIEAGQIKSQLPSHSFRVYVSTVTEGAPLLQAVHDGLQEIQHPSVCDDNSRLTYAAFIARIINIGDAASRLGMPSSTVKNRAARLQSALDPPVNIPPHIKRPPKN